MGRVLTVRIAKSKMAELMGRARLTPEDLAAALGWTQERTFYHLRKIEAGAAHKPKTVQLFLDVFSSRLGREVGMSELVAKR